MDPPKPRSGLHIATLLGIPIRLDLSWFIVLGLITWSLATGWFPVRHPEVTPSTAWVMGLIGALGLFASIVVHEFAHALVARREGVAIRSITLFLFGGVAEMEREPPTPGAEARIAIAGPIASLLLAILALLVSRVFSGTVLVTVALVVEYVGVINGVLAVFNLAPAFPLDGGRLVRAWLWRRDGNAQEATRRAAGMGSTFGAILIALGALTLLQGDLIGGVWAVFIGLFVRKAAATSVQQSVIRQTLQGAPVARFAETNIVAVQSKMNVERFVEDVMLAHHYKMFPVLDDEVLVGSLSTREVGAISRDLWGANAVGDIMKPLAESDLVRATDDAMDALTQMAQSGRTRLMVVDAQQELSGLLTLRDLLDFIQIAMDLGVAGTGERSVAPEPVAT